MHRSPYDFDVCSGPATPPPAPPQPAPAPAALDPAKATADRVTPR